MRRTAKLALFPALLALSAARPAPGQRAVILVRHAEKLDSSDDPLLSPAGEERAKRLAAMLKDAGVAAVVTTEYKRTQLTAAPLVKALHLVPEILSAKKPEETVAVLKKKHAQDVVLVVGHSNTLPPLIQKLGVAEAVTLDDDYDNLFIVVPRGKGPPTLLRLKF